MAEPFIKVSSRAQVPDVERQVRARAAICDDVFVLAEAGGYRHLRKLAQRLRSQPLQGREVKVFTRPAGGGLLAITAD